MEDLNGSGVERLLLSPEEAAEVLGVTRSTIYDLMRMRCWFRSRSVVVGLFQ
jgi:predicted DNA-binding transcriptional regulator AlpA